MRYKNNVLVLLLAILVLALGIGSVEAQSLPSLFVGLDHPGDLGPLSIYHYNDNFVDSLPPVVQAGAGCTAGNETCALFMNEGGTGFLRLEMNGATATYEPGRYYVVDLRDELYDGTANFDFTVPEEGYCWDITHRARYLGFGSGVPDGTAGLWMWDYPFDSGVVGLTDAFGTQYLTPNAAPHLSALAGKLTHGAVLDNEPFHVGSISRNSSAVSGVDITAWQVYRFEWCNRHGVGQTVRLTVDGHPGQHFINGGVTFGTLWPEFWNDTQNDFQLFDTPTVWTAMDVDYFQAQYVQR